MACILPKDIELLTARIEKMGLGKLRAMTSDKRVEFFYDFLTEKMQKGSFNEKKMRAEAEMYAARLEKQLLKPAEEDAAERWAATAKSPEAKQDILQMVVGDSEILQANNRGRLDALIRRKLGFSLNSKQTKQLLKIADAANKQLEDFKGMFEDFNADYDDRNYKNKKTGQDVRKEATALAKKMGEFKDLFDGYKLTNERRGESKFSQALYFLAGNWKALQASFDLSFGRQLGSAFYAGEAGTRSAWIEGIKAFWKALTDPAKVAEMQAMLFVRKNALNGNYSKFGLDLGMNEEAFPEAAVSKIPVLGKIFAASDQSYRLALQYARANIFDARWDMAMGDMNGNEGEVMRQFEQGEIGKYINSITGRGDTRGLLSEQGLRKANYLLFSPRYLAARIERVTDAFGYGWRSFGDRNDVRVMRGRAAMKQVLFSLALTLALRAAFDDDDDWFENAVNPLSGGFLHGEMFGVRIDTTFGQGGLMRDVARMLMGQSRTEEGVVVERATSKTLISFFKGKASPFATWSLAGGQLIGYYLGFRDHLPTDFRGKEMTWEHLVGAVMPITPVTARDVFYQDGEYKFHVDSLFGVALETLGVNTRVERPDEKKEGLSETVVREQGKIARAVQKSSPSSELSPLSSIMTKLSGAKRDRAALEFKREYNQAMERFIRSPAYKSMSMEKRAEAQRKIRTKAQSDIKKRYGIK